MSILYCIIGSMRGKWIPNYEGWYSVTKDGRVYTQRGRRYLKARLNPKTGYHHVTLMVSKVAKQYYVHRLVAITLLPNPKNLPYVNHKDGNTQNNRVRNLEWVTAAQNIEHAFRRSGRWTGKYTAAAMQMRKTPEARGLQKKLNQLVNEGVDVDFALNSLGVIGS